jgi:hypothetical protein
MKDQKMMNRKYVPWYLVGAAIVMAVLLASGVSSAVWVFVLIGLLCPLMMLFMMGGTQEADLVERQETAQMQTSTAVRALTVVNHQAVEVPRRQP